MDYQELAQLKVNSKSKVKVQRSKWMNAIARKATYPVEH